MHAVRLHAFGPAEKLRHERTEDPVPAPGQVRIAVRAAGVHLLDTVLRQGLPGPNPAPATLPTIPGREVAGTVDALGEGTDPAWLGRDVVAHLGNVPGGYAELAVTDADRLHPVPEGLGHAEAVAMIGTGRTTLGILAATPLGPDSVALVTAAAGGIGTLIVQYAKKAGATVIGLAGGPAKTARVRDNGADLAVDYTRPDWPRHVRIHLDALGRRATVLYDSVGSTTARAAFGLLGEGGQHVVYGWSGNNGPFTPSAGELAARSLTSENVLGPGLLKRGGGLRALEARALAEAAAGHLRPAIQSYPLARAADAHRDLETRGTVGKVVLIP
ncbi:zinc-binding dehydrogenase [Streptomyces drozdowiczii]|uniref:Zinc-binding dehydrogenase n=1 Tax=Streptomyces drozdowiczii TaxID=202862 RepID=A0ABY6PSA4_9ACTN|nr:zinc-binding dehydrogenase [Streptomyces drozdowiczii]MCX0245165.1 zinc-binding dehydrogenase [Streptomyces drozdowiczii]UZK55160.1 zinc-binding dehydrogenase [Streptomyces drozdowiczii]